MRLEKKKGFGAEIAYVGELVYGYRKFVSSMMRRCNHIEDICNEFDVDINYFKGTMTLEDAVDYSGYNHQRIERIKELMQKKGISTNKKLSKLSGVSTTSMSDIMTEKNMLTEDKAQKIADALDVGIDWLLYGEEVKKDYPITNELLNWLWDHPEIRKELWERYKPSQK